MINIHPFKLDVTPYKQIYSTFFLGKIITQHMKHLEKKKLNF